MFLWQTWDDETSCGDSRSKNVSRLNHYFFSFPAFLFTSKIKLYANCINVTHPLFCFIFYLLGFVVFFRSEFRVLIFSTFWFSFFFFFHSVSFFPFFWILYAPSPNSPPCIFLAAGAYIIRICTVYYELSPLLWVLARNAHIGWPARFGLNL